MKTLQSLCILVIMSASLVHAQSFNNDVSKRGTTAGQFLSIGQGARGISMGSAYTGVVKDASAMYWNPAGIAEYDGANVVFDHTEWFASLKYNYIAGTYKINGLGTIGMSLTTSDIGEMDVTTIDAPNGTGETFSVRDAAFSVCYALKLTDRFSIGFNPKVVYQSIWKTSATALALDMGVRYVTPFDDIVLAMSISNFGSKMQLLGNSTIVLYDQDISSTGNNGKIPANLSTDEWALPIIFRVGLSYNVMNTEMNKLLVAVDAVHPSDNYEYLNAGAEYTFDDFVSLRAGYKALFLKDSEEGLSLGFGIKQALLGNIILNVDYAYQDFGRLKNVQKFSFGICF
jgi:long-subunit fatty acid transport protein